MAYTTQSWMDYPSTSTPITADRLGHIEDGIYAAAQTADSAAGAAASVATGKADRDDKALWSLDYPTLQDAVTATPSGGILIIPGGNTIVTSPIVIDHPMTLMGGGAYHSRIQAVGCDAIQIPAGVNGIKITNLELSQSVRYTTTANTNAGIRVQGTAGSYCANHTFRDLYIDGFEAGVESEYLWKTDFDNVRTAFGKFGISAYGLSENVTVRGCHLVVGDGTSTRVPGSCSISLRGQTSKAVTTGVVSEGWIITGNVLFNGDYGLDAPGYANYQFANNIVDYIHVSGVRVIHNGTAYGGNALIQGNYFAMAPNAASTAAMIDVQNTQGGTRGVRIIGNDFLVYAGGSVSYGIRVTNDASSLAVIVGNIINGSTLADIYIQSSGSLVMGNRCSTPTIDNIQVVSGQHNVVTGNQARVLLTGTTFPNVFDVVAGRRVFRGTAAAPTGLAWEVGDRVVRHPPVVGQPKGWVCTVAGSPGTWVSEGNL